MKNIVIIEDETPALNRIKRLLGALVPDANIKAEIRSVEEGRAWFEENTAMGIDLIFSDIHLSDGLAFDIFEDYVITTPIIFTTAFDEYSLKAFSTTGIDYLLKPIDKDKLSEAIEKFRDLQRRFAKSNPTDDGTVRTGSDLSQLFSQFQNNGQNDSYPNLLGDFKYKLVPFSSKDVICFIIEQQQCTAVTTSQRYPMSESLEQIGSRLPDYQFFRANRQSLIHRAFIKSVEQYYHGKLLIQMDTKEKFEPIIVSKEKAAAFRQWLQK